MQKRGLAPIYTTLLFLLVALSIGITIMYISKNTQTTISCDYNINLKLLEIGGQDDICIQDNTLKFTIENGVDVDLEGLMLHYGADQKKQISSKVTKGGIYSDTIEFLPPMEDLLIVPIILEGNEEIDCPEQSLSIQEIRSC
tara:strand:+ start:330 stop:755 length:426 start_codon:yes stop_codon:yes gene_type:complete